MRLPLAVRRRNYRPSETLVSLDNVYVYPSGQGGTLATAYIPSFQARVAGASVVKVLASGDHREGSLAVRAGMSAVAQKSDKNCQVRGGLVRSAFYVEQKDPLLGCAARRQNQVWDLRSLLPCSGHRFVRT